MGKRRHNTPRQVLATDTLSIKPSIAECERFVKFLSERFGLDIDGRDLLITIEDTHRNTRGFFRSVKCEKVWRDGRVIEKVLFKQQEIEPSKMAYNSIVLSSHELKREPYMVLTHEIAHYLNTREGIKDCSSNQYHNKHFKTRAESLLLECLSGFRGYALTNATPEFNEMIKEFKPSQNAFKIFQETAEPKAKKPSRMLKFECECYCIIRSAKNEHRPLKAVCSYCETEFKEVSE